MTRETLTREAIYERVWAEAIVKVAAQLGLSDRGLAKMCVSRQIPVPPRGYWAKLAHGKPVAKPPLPPWKGPGDGSISIGKPKPSPPTPDIDEIAAERLPENRITVPERLGKLHSLVARTKSALAAQKVGDRGLLHPPSGVLNVKVSKPLVQRALRVMQALLTALEARGYPISIDAKEGITFATVMGEQVGFRLIERAKQVTAKPADHRWRYVQDGWMKNDPFDLVPSGVLALEVGEAWFRKGVEDGSVPIEERLNAFVIKLVEEGLKDRRIREEREAAAAESRERERLRSIEAEARRREVRRITEWDELMSAWKRTREIRAFTRAIRRRLGPLEEGSKTFEWVTWAEQYANSIDPLR